MLDPLIISKTSHWWLQMGRGGGGPRPPGKSQVAMGFLRNTGTDPLEQHQFDPWGPITSRGKFIRPFRLNK